MAQKRAEVFAVTLCVANQTAALCKARAAGLAVRRATLGYCGIWC